MKTLIQQARVIDPASSTDKTADVLIANGIVEKIGKAIKDKDAETIDAKGLWLLPGLVDIHVHFREPGGEGKETIDTGSMAAAAGGVTSVVCMANTNPPIDNKTEVDFILDRVMRSGKARVYPSGTVTKGRLGKEIAPIGEMVEAGIVAISDDGSGIMDAMVTRRAMEYSKIFNIPLMIHPEEHTLTEGGSLNEGKMSTMLGLIGCPKESEIIQIARDLILAKRTGAHLHVTHVSAADSVDLIRFYKAKGVRVTAEASPHHLTLTEDSCMGYNTDAKMNPPLRTFEDQEALYEGLKDGTIDCIATDHAPHTPEEKNAAYPDAPFGIIGLETLLPLTFGKIQARLGFDDMHMLSLVTDKPAKLMKLPGGTITEGKAADLTLWDPEPVYKLDKHKMHSKSINTPFHGWEVKGRVVTTFLGGNVVYRYTES